MQKRTGVATRLQQALEEAGRSVYWLHREVQRRTNGARGSSYSAMRQYASGDIRNPRRDILEAAASALGIRAAYLIDGDGEPTLDTAFVSFLESRTTLPDEGPGFDVDEALEQWLARWERKRQNNEQRQILAGDLAPWGVSAAVRAVFVEAWRRYVRGCPDRELSPDQQAEIAAELWDVAIAPLGRWGFREDLEPGNPNFDRRAFVSFALSMLNALMQAMPAAGAGDPIAQLDFEVEPSAATPDPDAE